MILRKEIVKETSWILSSFSQEPMQFRFLEAQKVILYLHVTERIYIQTLTCSIPKH